MNDEQIRPLLKAWLRARSAGPADVPDGVARVVARLPHTRQRSRWWPLPAFDRPGPIPVTSERLSGRGFTTTSTLKFVVAGVMVALFGGSLLAGIFTSRQDGELLPGVVSESPSGALTSCPAGSTPDQPGPADQARPPGRENVAVALDRRVGQLMYHTATRGVPETWTLDVCTNTWALAQRGDGPATDAWFLDALYDERAGTIITVAGAESAWTFDLPTASWTERQTPPFADAGPVRLVYDRGAGRTVAIALQQPFRMWSYDASADEWHHVDPTGPLPFDEYGFHILAVYDRSVDRLLAYHFGHTALFDEVSGSWETAGTRAPVFVYGGYESYGGEIVYDEAASRTVLISDGLVIAYDAAAGDWATLWGEERGEYLDDGIAVEGPVRGPLGGTDHHLVFDPLNDRIIVVGGSTSTFAGWAPREDVWAFDAVDSEWTELVPASDDDESSRLGRGWTPAEPITTEALLAGMVTEEVEPGVRRIVNDVVRDLQPVDVAEPDFGGEHLIVAGLDGSVWRFGPELSFRLGEVGQLDVPDWGLGLSEADTKIGPDGRVWITVAHGEGSTELLVSGDQGSRDRVIPMVEDPTLLAGEEREHLAIEPLADGAVWALAGEVAVDGDPGTHAKRELGPLDTYVITADATSATD